jgi:hypothetical protein
MWAFLLRPKKTTADRSAAVTGGRESVPASVAGAGAGVMCFVVVSFVYSYDTKKFESFCVFLVFTAF